jgi:membrane associated rhomboid family serine protease
MLPIKDINRPSRPAIVTKMLIAINIVVFVYTYLKPLRVFQQIVYEYGVKPALILQGKELYTLFTGMFLHGDITHIFGNMLYLWIFGDNVEDRLGHTTFLVFYISSGVIASLVQVFFTPSSMVPMIGASGAVSAVLGAYLIMFPWARVLTLIFGWFIWMVEIPAYYYLGFWFLLQFLYGLISLRGVALYIAYWAHISGFILGIIVAIYARYKYRRRLYREPYEVIWI